MLRSADVPLGEGDQIKATILILVYLRKSLHFSVMVQDSISANIDI